MCAIEALENVDTLIFGGMDRGLDYTAFEEALASSSVRNLIGLPETGHQILDTLRTWGTGKNLFRAEDMQQAVKAAYAYTTGRNLSLLLPHPAIIFIKILKRRAGTIKTWFAPMGRTFLKMIDCAPPGACALPKTAAEMLERERELSAHVEALTLFQKQKRKRSAQSLL